MGPATKENKKSLISDNIFLETTGDSGQFFNLMELKVPISQHFSTGYNFGMKFYTKIKYIGLT